MKTLGAYPKLNAKFIKAVLALVCLSALIITGSYWYESYREEEEFEAEEREGIPAVLKQMDLWSDMRTYPGEEMQSEEFIQSYELATAMEKTEASNIGRTGVNASPWVNLAPMNFAGRILSIAFHPTNPNVMWVGSASGGLWKTTNGGTGAANGINWQYVPTGFPVLGVGSIVVNPSNANEIYVGTGEVYSSFPGGSTGAGHIRVFRGSYGVGILKSIDGGVTWTKSYDFNKSSLVGVMDMVINPSNPAIVYAATTDGVYRTTNSGANWSKVLNVTYAMDMVYKPGDPNILYVSCGNFQSAGTGIYKTTNANAATPAFAQLTSANFPNPISGKIQLAISANNTSRIYASIGRDPGTSHTQGLYVSNDQGATWFAAAAPTILANQGWYGHDVAVSQTNASRVLWAELNTFVSINGGTSFTQTGTWSEWDVANTNVGDLTEGQSDGNETDYVHADIHRISPSPHDATGNTFFICSDGGLFRTTDGGSTFNTLNGGLNTAQIYANMAQHPTNPNYMLLGLQDNEAMIYEGNTGCRRIGSLGDGFHAAMNSTGTIQLVESYYFNRRRSSNSGGTWGAGSNAVDTNVEAACFNVPMVFSKTAGSLYMFAGTSLFKRSTDGGATWSNLNGGNHISGPKNPAIAMTAPTNSIVYFSTAPANGVRSRLWKTTNATVANPTFTEITGSLPDRYYSDIEADPADPNRLFVTLSGFGSSHIYMSLNGGSTWSNLGDGLPDVPHNTVFVNPSARGQVYVGNDLGVFVANNVPTSGVLGATTTVYWNNYSTGLGDAVIASDLQINSAGKLRLGTYGRGLWEGDLASLTLPVVLKQFKGWAADQGNELTWLVSSQMDVKHFEVEYTPVGGQFKKLAVVNARTGSGDIRYNYLHQFDKSSDILYRIKIVDTDGSFKYSSVELVRANNLFTKVTLFPNPATDAVNLKVVVKKEAAMDVQIYNTVGALVATDRRLMRKGENSFSLNIQRFPAGSYQVVCQAENGKWITTLLKK